LLLPNPPVLLRGESLTYKGLSRCPPELQDETLLIDLIA